MAERRVIWADAFTDRALAGNPCAVVFDADAVDVETRIAITRETRLSECAFLQASAAADFGVRYYTASGEIPMAGHPTIATAAALERAGLLAGRERFTLEVGAGVLPVEIHRAPAAPTLFVMTQAAPQFLRRYHPAEIAALVGLSAAEIVAPPETVSTGTPFCITLVRDRAALMRARLDEAALDAFKRQADFFEPFLVALGGFTDQGQTAARMMLTPPEPPEDPFTGSATGCMAAFLWARGLIESPRFVAEQGHGMGRPGAALVEVLGARDAIAGVRVGGTAVVLMDGTIFL